MQKFMLLYDGANETNTQLITPLIKLMLMAGEPMLIMNIVVYDTIMNTVT